MNLRYCLNSVYNCLPLSRLKLLEDVVLYRSCGSIYKIWLYAGHIFVGLDDGRKLITFDSKTVDLIQDVETDGCLDLHLKYPILTILTWPPNGVIIVLQNGDVQHWIFGQDYKWQKLNELYICKNVGAIVTSVCHNVAQNSLYWCEKIQREKEDVFTLFKRPIKEDESLKHHLKLGSITSLIKNCCDGSLYPMGHGIVYVPCGNPTNMCITLCTLTGGVDVVVGRQRVFLTDVNIHTPFNYSQVILNAISILHKQKGQPHVVKMCYITSSQTLIQLYSDGMVTSIRPSQETDDQPVSIKLVDASTTGVKNIIPLRQCLCLVYQSEIRVFRLKTGVLICSLSCDDQVDIEGICESLFGNQQSGVYTENSLYFIQRERTTQRQRDDQTLINTGHYQSQAIQLSYLDRMQKTTYEASSVQAIDQLRSKWQHDSGSNPKTKLSEIVDPYLREYWKLENMLKDRCDHPQMIQDMDVNSVHNEVDRLLHPKTKLSNSSRQTQLLLLSEWHPEDVLESLLERFDLTNDELSTSQTHKWQCILSVETANLAGSCDIPVPLFELITHLLYKYKPDLLAKFLRRSQNVWDKKIGMSAFIRRRQSLLIYERALKCFPEPSVSKDLETAVVVHVYVLLTSETENGFLKSVRLLLKYQKWPEAIELYKEKKDHSKQAYLLYQMIISALTQFQVLHEYADTIFPLMPSVNCTDGMQYVNKDNTIPDVLCTDSDSISMKSVRPYLLDSINQLIQ